MISEKLSIVVPVYNEVTSIRDVFVYFQKLKTPIEIEWIVVDDASSDGTAEILREMSKKFGFQLLFQSRNQGKGAAVRAGLMVCTGSLIMIQDADFEYSIFDIPKLIEPLLSENADVVFGSRFKKSSTQVHRTYHYFINRFLTFLSNLLSGIYLTDMETCYKVFRADLLKSMNLKSERFGIEVELTAYLAKSEARVYEVPIEYFPRSYLQGKKISWKDGVAAIWHLVRFNLIESKADAFKGLPKKYELSYNRRKEISV